MEIVPYKQSLTHSCLTACLLMLIKAKYGIDFDEAIEQDLSLKGSKRLHSFYVVGIVKEIVNKYQTKVSVTVDNKYFARILEKQINDKKIEIKHQKITLELVLELLKTTPLICHIDNNYLGDYSHSSHFIILVKATEKNIIFVDTLTGKKGLISPNKLEKAILSLKKHIKMCPLLFSLS